MRTGPSRWHVDLTWRGRGGECESPVATAYALGGPGPASAFRATAKKICLTSVTEEDLNRAAELIRAGGLVAFPTETVYGLGANALNADAVMRIYKAKQRPWASPLIVHVADEAMARSVTAEWPPLAQQLAARFWPGPLTIIVRKADIVPDLVTAGLDTVGRSASRLSVRRRRRLRDRQCRR